MDNTITVAGRGGIHDVPDLTRLEVTEEEYSKYTI